MGPTPDNASPVTTRNAITTTANDVSQRSPTKTSISYTFNNSTGSAGNCLKRAMALMEHIQNEILENSEPDDEFVTVQPLQPLDTVTNVQIPSNIQQQQQQSLDVLLPVMCSESLQTLPVASIPQECPKKRPRMFGQSLPLEDSTNVSRRIRTFTRKKVSSPPKRSSTTITSGMFSQVRMFFWGFRSSRLLSTCTERLRACGGVAVDNLSEAEFVVVSRDDCVGRLGLDTLKEALPKDFKGTVVWSDWYSRSLHRQKFGEAQEDPSQFLVFAATNSTTFECSPLSDTSSSSSPDTEPHSPATRKVRQHTRAALFL
eukprot:c17731_g1_i1.p1 GENE.c17731_g1_i1~~c17731_g1_i1.p1  ORF type:complete len:315 (-),score=88.67 c17731_g1_i1:147-1091(-)